MPGGWAMISRAGEMGGVVAAGGAGDGGAVVAEAVAARPRDHDGRRRGLFRHGELVEERLEGLGNDVRNRRRVEPLLLEVVLGGDAGEHVLHHRDEGLENPVSTGRDGLESLAAPGVQGAVEVLPGQEGLEVPLVVLQDEGDFLRDEAVGEEVDLHVLEGRRVLPRHRLLAVGHEDDRVRPRQDHPAGRVVLDLARYRVELDLEVVSRDPPEAEREQVEEQGPVLCGIERDEPVGPVGVGQTVNLLEIRGLPRLGRPVVDHLGFDGPFAEVELDHGRAGTIARGRSGQQ